MTERQYVDFRMEMFNAFNHASWGAPGRDITNPGAFGQITSPGAEPAEHPVRFEVLFLASREGRGNPALSSIRHRPACLNPHVKHIQHHRQVRRK